MKQKKKKAQYPGKMGTLYLIVKAVCDLCLTELKAFSGFKVKYTPEFFNAILEAMAAAKAMPNFGSRQSKQIALRKQLAKLNKSVMRTFQRLMRYANDAFAEDELENMRKAAGGDLYAETSQENWKASTDMQEMMSQFMNDYAAELAKGGMPVDFAPRFGELSGQFAATLALYVSSRTSSSKETGSKVDANNALYKRIIDVMDDGKEIFVDDPAMAEQFNYAWLSVKLGGQGATGFRFSLKEADTLVPVQTASVSFLPSGHQFEIEEEAGVIDVYLPELKRGEFYSYQLTAPGYEEMVGTLVANTGVMHRVDLVMKKAVMSVEPASEGVKKIG